MSSLNDILSSSDLDIEQKIVQELLNNENLETKTELNKPMLWSGVAMLEDFYDIHQLNKSKHLLNHFSAITFRYLISLNRKGRLEYLEALKGMKDKIEDKNPIAMGMNPTN